MAFRIVDSFTYTLHSILSESRFGFAKPNFRIAILRMSFAHFDKRENDCKAKILFLTLGYTLPLLSFAVTTIHSLNSLSIPTQHRDKLHICKRLRGYDTLHQCQIISFHFYISTDVGCSVVATFKRKMNLCNIQK